MNNQLSIKALNHVALQISNIDISRDFYSQVLDLQEIPTPAFDYPVVWFSLGAGRELHLVGRETDIKTIPIRGNHFALEVANVYQAEKHLQEKGIPYLPIKYRPDGAKQLFLNDPDGHFIELCQLIVS